MNPTDLLVERHPDYRTAFDRHVRLIEKRDAAGARVTALEREVAKLTAAEIDGETAGETKRARTKLGRAQSEYRALWDECERAGRALDRMSLENKRDWKHQAQHDFAAGLASYELALLGARERLADELALVSFLAEKPVGMPTTVRVHASGVQGLAHDVAVRDVLQALKDEITGLDLAALLAGRP